jgi:hypothetical protein
MVVIMVVMVNDYGDFNHQLVGGIPVYLPSEKYESQLG